MRKDISILVKKQTKEFTKVYFDNGQPKTIFLKIRYDDNCGNGKNSFAMTATIYNGAYESEPRSEKNLDCCGCCHEEIKKAFPEFAHLLKWHLMNSNGPMHYIANTLYHIKEVKEYNYFIYLNYNKKNHIIEFVKTENESEFKGKFNKILKEFKGKDITYKKEDSGMSKESNLKAARSCAIWEDAKVEDITKDNLLARLPKLIEDFKKDIEKIGLIF